MRLFANIIHMNRVENVQYTNGLNTCLAKVQGNLFAILAISEASSGNNQNNYSKMNKNKFYTKIEPKSK